MSKFLDLTGLDHLVSRIKGLLSNVYKAKGTYLFSQIPSSAQMTSEKQGFVYNISEPFTTDNRFVGYDSSTGGRSYPAGTNIVIINDGTDQAPSWKYDILAGLTDLSNYVAKTGDTMSGALNMGSQKITSLATPTENTDASTKKYVDDQVANKQNTLTAGANITISENTISATDTTYSAATTSADGLMSAADKTTFDNLSNTYVSKAGDTMTGGLTSPNLTSGTRKTGSTIGDYSFVAGRDNTASASEAIALGVATQATQQSAISYGLSWQGDKIISNGIGAVAGGYQRGTGIITANGTGSLALGLIGYSSSSNQGGNITASGGGSLAIGRTIGSYAILSSGAGSIAMGNAEIGNITASGAGAIATGSLTSATGNYSFASGTGTTASSLAQRVEGQYNVIDNGGSATTRGTYAHIVGNGTSTSARSNAHTLDWSGNAWFAGTVKVGSNNTPLITAVSPALTGSPTAPTQSVNDNSTKIATTEYVERKVKYGTSDYTAGTTALATGSIYCMYE